MGNGYSSSLPQAPRQKDFILVATDYFSKRVKAKSYANIKDSDVATFVWKKIVTRFNLPQIIIANNGSQFISQKFKNFCSTWKFRVRCSILGHPQGNGQAKAMNKIIMNTLKKKLEESKEKWVEELSGVLWAYRTTVREPISFTPFSLVYGMDAMLPAKVFELTIQTGRNLLYLNDHMLKQTLDESEEKKKVVAIRLA